MSDEEKNATPTEHDPVGNGFAVLVMALGGAIVLLLVERVLGRGWRSPWSFFSTVALLWVGLLPFAVIDSGKGQQYPRGFGIGAAFGAAIGLAYGLVFKSPLPGLVFGACIGHLVGMVLHFRGFEVASFRSRKGLWMGVAVAGAILACHLVGVMKPTKLIRGNAVAADTAEGNQSKSQPDKQSRFFTQSEMQVICKKAERLQIGATRGEVIALLGPPGIARSGDKSDFLVWAMDEKEQRFCVVVGIQGDVVFKLDRDSGLVFEQADMVALLKKAQTLRLGMTLQEVLRVMGPASSRHEMVMDWLKSFDSVTEEMHMAKKRLLTVTWTSEDSNDRFVMVGLNETGVFNVGCNQPGRGQVYELKR